MNALNFTLNRIANDYGIDYSMVENLLRIVIKRSELSKLSPEKLIQIWERDCSSILECQLADIGFAA